MPSMYRLNTLVLQFNVMRICGAVTVVLGVLVFLPQGGGFRITGSPLHAHGKSEEDASRRIELGEHTYDSVTPIRNERTDEEGPRADPEAPRPLSRRKLALMTLWGIGAGALHSTSRTALARETPKNDSGIKGTIDVIVKGLKPPGEGCKRIFLCRHGQTDYNSIKICQGRRLNPPLNATGRDQAQHLLIGVDLQCILSSPLQRAQETAEIVRRSHPAAVTQVLADLNEVDFGTAEGLPKPLAAGILAPTFLAWSMQHYEVQAGKSGESGEEVKRRVTGAVASLLKACDEGQQTLLQGRGFMSAEQNANYTFLNYLVLAVSHSSMIKFMLATLLEIPLMTVRSMGQGNCSLNVLDYNVDTCEFKALLVNGAAPSWEAEGHGDAVPSKYKSAIPVTE